MSQYDTKGKMKTKSLRKNTSETNKCYMQIKNLLTGIILLAPAIFFGITDKPIEMGLIIIPSIIGAVIFNVDSLKHSFKILKMKDLEIQFQEAIDKAYVTVFQLKELQHIMTTSTLDIVYRSKFIGGMGAEETFDLVMDLYSVAENLNNYKTINEPLKLGYERLLSEAFGNICSMLHTNNMTKAKLEAIYEYRGNTSIIIDGKFIPTSEAVKNFLKQENIDAEENNIKNAILLYGKVLSDYQNKYGTIQTVSQVSAV